jgi:hypothetical protein
LCYAAPLAGVELQLSGGKVVFLSNWAQMLSEQTVTVDKEFAHDGGEGKFFGFAGFEQPLVKARKTELW